MEKSETHPATADREIPITTPFNIYSSKYLKKSIKCHVSHMSGSKTAKHNTLAKIKLPIDRAHSNIFTKQRPLSRQEEAPLLQ